MTSTRVSFADPDITVAMDDRPFDAMRQQALFRTQALDELTQAALRVPIQVHIEQPRMSVRSMTDGMIGVVGRPWDVVNPLNAAELPLNLRLSASRYLERFINEQVPYTQRHVTVGGTGPVITLDNVTHLQPGQAVLVGPGAVGESAEVARIAALGPGAFDVTLQTRLGGMHSVGSIVVADAFAAGGPAQLFMHRAPLRLVGRAIRRTVSGTAALAGATVRISKLWRRIPAANSSMNPEPPIPGMMPPPGPWPAAWTPPIAEISPPLYRNYPVTSNVTVENRPLDVAMPNKYLMQASVVHDDSVQVTDRINLLANHVIDIDAGDPSRREIVRVVQVIGASTADQAARVLLAHPLRFAHHAGALVQKLGAPIGGGAISQLNELALENDPCVLMDTRFITALQQVVIEEIGVPASRAYHQLVTYQTQTDSNGYYALPLLSRAGKIELSAHHAGLPIVSGSTEFIPDYTAAENRIDLLLA